MNRIAASILLVLCAVAAGASVSAGTALGLTSPLAVAAPEPAFNLDADVARVMKTFDVPGIAIAIVKDGKLVTARGFGVRKLGHPEAVDANTLFEIASNSKAFTVAALAMLVDQGTLAWDDPVTRHLPDFQMFDAYVTREMTVRDLLTHRSGFGLGAGDLLWWPGTRFSSDEIIEKLRYIRPATSFRASYAYDNVLYIVAAKIIANKSGKSWGETVRGSILQPLGMTATTTSLLENAGNPNLANAHSKIDGKVAAVKAIAVPNAAGAVGINSNAADLARWMTVLLDGGALKSAPNDAQGREARLFSAAQGRELWTAQTLMKITEPVPVLAATRPNFFAYGLGFQLRDYHGKKLALHGGALQGFYTRVVLVPEAKLGIAILTNAESGGALTALQYRLLDHYLGAAPSDWISLVRDADTAAHATELARQDSALDTRAAHSQPSLALAAYDGEYQDTWYGKASIKTVGGKHVLSFAMTPDLVGELEHFQHDTFIVRWKERNFGADAYVTFALNPDGSIERMKMAPISTETDFSYDFADLTFVPVTVKKAEAK
ncbi:MAG: serine hydrolase [Massilia sp.]|nr:serine hydrolase [Massilia sp.]